MASLPTRTQPLPGAAPDEAEVQALARSIAAAGASEPGRVFRAGWIADRLLDWAMGHPRFKTQLFRFVDVFPACRDDADVMRHVAEYFETGTAPRALEVGLDVAEHVPFGATLTAAAARRNVARMARQFIAGASPRQALPRLRRRWRLGEAATVDLLGERTVTPGEGDRYAARVRAMLDALAADASRWPAHPRLERDPWGAVPRANVSVKPTALTPFFGPLTAERGLAEAVSRLRPIVARAAEVGATIHLDAEHDETKDLTLALVRALGAELPRGAHLGCVVQAYRTDACDDLAALIAWAERTLATPLQIRLVKGAYWDLERAVAEAEGWPWPVFDGKERTDASFERCARLLAAHAPRSGGGSTTPVRPAFGSHNLRSLAYAVAAARAAGRDDSAIELQLLYGMAEPVHAALRRLGFRVRVYAPVGELVPGMAYLVRRLLENTSNESFIRHRFAEGRALDELVAPPPAVEQAPRGHTEAPSPPATDVDDAGPFRNEPHAELRRPRPRARLTTAIDAAPASFPFRAPLRIAGRPRPTRAEIVSVDPGAVGTVVCRSGRAGPEEAAEAIDVAVRAAAEWRAAPWRDRAAVLFAAAARFRARRAELAALEVYEAGKPPAEADADVCEAIDFCEYYGRAALRLGAGAPLLDVPGERNAQSYQPRGVGAVIAPWNFPLAIPTGMVAAALVTGNAVVFKPAEQTPGIGARLVDVLLEAGVPPGVLAFLPGIGEEVGPALVEHPAVAFVAFTGSKDVGLSIVERAAAHRPGQRQVKRVIAELGGKNAIVVDTDADLDQAIPAIVQSAFGYAGQKCSAAARVIAIGPVFDELLGRLVPAVAALPIGHARELGTVVGPLIDGDALARVQRYQALARVEGEVRLQRDDLPSGGWYAGPTVVVARDPEARIVTDEIFGPVLVALRADDFDHALALANATPYALTAGVFSRLPSHIERAAAELRAGNVYVNRAITGARVGRQPFGGYGLSGIGTKAGSPEYLLQLVDSRVVTENTIRQGFTPE